VLPDAMPNVAKFGKFMKRLVKGVEIITLNDPDATPPEDEAFLRQLIADYKGKKVGRPKNKVPGYCKDRRLRFQKLARKLRKQKWSWTQITDEVNRRAVKAGLRPMSRSGVKEMVLRILKT
jgi:hypothetical protein